MCKRCSTDCDPKELLLDMAYGGRELDMQWRERQDYHKYPKQNARKNQNNASKFASVRPKS